MNFPIFVQKGEVKRTLSPLRRHILTVSGYKNNEINISTLSHQTVYQVTNGCFRKKNCIILIGQYTFPNSNPIDFTKKKLYYWLSNDVECRTTIENLGKQKIALLLNDNTILQGSKSQAATKLIDYLNIDNNFNLIFR